MRVVLRYIVRLTEKEPFFCGAICQSEIAFPLRLIGWTHLEPIVMDARRRIPALRRYIEVRAFEVEIEFLPVEIRLQFEAVRFASHIVEVRAVVESRTVEV